MSEKEKFEYERFNWKNQAVSRVTKNCLIWWNLIKKWDYVFASWSFKLKWTNIMIDMPNFCALYLDMANKAYNNSDGYLVFKNFKNNEPINHEELFIYIQDRISNIIFAFTWLEAFLNENIWAIENYDEKYRYKYIDKYTNEKKEKWPNRIIDDFSINKKIDVIYDFYKIQKDSNITESINKISKIRSRLVHFKRKDTINFNAWEWTIFDELLDKNFINYAKLVYDIIEYFVNNSDKEKSISPYWYSRKDNCFKK